MRPAQAIGLIRLFFGYIAFGDWGLLLAQLGSLGEIWHRVPYGATIIVGLNGYSRRPGRRGRWHDVACGTPLLRAGAKAMGTWIRRATR